MKTYKKIVFKYCLILLILIFCIHTTFIIGQQSIRKVIESDRFFLFLMKSTFLNLDKLSKYQPTNEEKIELEKILKNIINNWKIDESSNK